MSQQPFRGAQQQFRPRGLGLRWSDNQSLRGPYHSPHRQGGPRQSGMTGHARPFMYEGTTRHSGSQLQGGFPRQCGPPVPPVPPRFPVQSESPNFYQNYSSPPPQNNNPAYSEVRSGNPNRFQQADLPPMRQTPASENMMLPNARFNAPPEPIPPAFIPQSMPPFIHQSTPPPNFTPTQMQSGTAAGTSTSENDVGLNETDKPEREKDVGWLKQWLNERKIKKEKSSFNAPKALSINDATKLFRDAIEVLEQIKTEKQVLRSILNTGDQILWQNQILIISSLKEKFKMLQATISSQDISGLIIKKMEAAKKRKARIKRRKDEIRLENQEKELRIEETEKKIDSWRNKILEKELEKQREKEVKKAADKTLSEVRKKLADANKSLELIKAVTKLRAARKDSMQSKGLYTPKETDVKFEEKSNKMVEMLNSQLKVYEAEQKTLQVMLDIEQEANLEKERELLKVREEMWLEREEMRIKNMLFGNDDIPDEQDPILPYRQYYEAAEHDVNALIQIRQTWDMYVVPPGTIGGSNIPLTWVVPAEPSDDTWASCLKNTP